MNLHTKIPFPPLWPLLKDTGERFSRDNALRLSAALSYYSIFSIAPLLLIAISITGAIMGAEAARGQLYDELRYTFGPQASATLEDMIASTNKPAANIWMSLAGTAALLFGASGAFGQLKEALNTIWEVEPPKGNGILRFIKDRFLSFAMVLGTGFLLLTSMILTTALDALSGWIGSATTLPVALWQAISFLITFTLISALFAAIFKVLPDRLILWRDVVVGALTTALLFHLGKFALGIYLARESTSSAYGAAGSVVLILLWVYYTSVIVFFGAEFTRSYSEWRTKLSPP